MRISIVTLTLILAAAVSSTAYSPAEYIQAPAAVQQDPLIGRHFMDVQSRDADGKVHKLSEYAGKGRWVLLDFWASWCGPCQEEMPNVVSAYKKFHGKGFDIVGISLDQSKDEWLGAIQSWGLNWIHLSDLG
ncbi:MAG: redoxin domain-containing protein [Bacteroidales bacterium]|nr:redoxin domain-containing protein [Bacteroidales bacterium]